MMCKYIQRSACQVVPRTVQRILGSAWIGMGLGHPVSLLVCGSRTVVLVMQLMDCVSGVCSLVSLICLLRGRVGLAWPWTAAVGRSSARRSTRSATQVHAGAIALNCRQPPGRSLVQPACGAAIQPSRMKVYACSAWTTHLIGPASAIATIALATPGGFNVHRK